MTSPKIVLDDDERFALMKLRRNVVDVTKPHHDDYFLLRWLRARNWNIVAAEKMLRESLQWRLYWEIDTKLKTWEPPDALRLYYPSGTTGCDAEGCPVFFLSFAELDIVGLLHSVSKQDLVRLTIKVLEDVLDMAAKAGGKKVLVVFDMTGFVLKDYAWRPAAELVIALLKMYEANYPEILKRCFIVNAPTVFAVAFAVVKRFLNDYTIGKIAIYKTDPRKWTKVLKENIPQNVLPKFYGGELVDPDGNPKCPSKIRPGGKVPKSYYTNTFNDSNDEEFTTIAVKKGKTVCLDYIVAEEGCVLKWEFRTEGHDIKFGVTCCDSEGNVSSAIDTHRVSTHLSSEIGAVACQAPATYTFTFDNSYSLFRNKKIHYNITLTESVNHVEGVILPDTDFKTDTTTTNGNTDAKN